MFTCGIEPFNVSSTVFEKYKKRPFSAPTKQKSLQPIKALIGTLGYVTEITNEARCKRVASPTCVKLSTTVCFDYYFLVYTHRRRRAVDLLHVVHQSTQF
jgi:hypothetical protein